MNQAQLAQLLNERVLLEMVLKAFLQDTENLGAPSEETLEAGWNLLGQLS
jgi:hypothetical protein